MRGNGSKFISFTNTNFNVIRLNIYIEDGYIQKWVKIKSSLHTGTT